MSKKANSKAKVENENKEVGVYDEKFFQNRFFLKYALFVDRELAKSNLELYKQKLNYVGKITKDIDFTKNIFVVCTKDIAKELFLTGFSRLDSYRTFDYYNVGELVDIYFGTRNSYRNETDEYTINSNLELTRDVLCMTINYYEMSNKLRDEIAYSTIMVRSQGRGSGINSTKGKVNWVFFMGSESEIDGICPSTRNIFTNEGRPNFDYYDLNSGKKVLGTNSSVNGMGSKTSVTKSSSVDELY